MGGGTMASGCFHCVQRTIPFGCWERGLSHLSGLLCLAVILSVSGDGHVLASLPAPPAPARLQAQLMQLPLSFEANQGQVASRVQFLARGAGHTLFLSPTEAVLAFRAGEKGEKSAKGGKGERGGTSETRGEGRMFGVGSQVSGSDQPLTPNTQNPILRMKLLGSNPAPSASGHDKQEGIVNYFIGNDPAKWRTNIPTYAKVQYDGVYPGIDLVYYGTTQRQLEYDFVVAPGADPRQVAVTCDGAEQIAVDEHGDLILTLEKGLAVSVAVSFRAFLARLASHTTWVSTCTRLTPPIP